MTDIVEIPLTHGYVAVVDAIDAHLAGFKWYAQERRKKDGSLYAVYAVRSEYLGKVGGTFKHRHHRMHREILGFPALDVDHWDGDGLNNRRINLRQSTKSQNMANRQKNINSSSPWKGVYWYPIKSKWHASVSIQGKRRSLGYFKDECDAATAYNFAAAEAFGQFSRLNVPAKEAVAA